MIPEDQWVLWRIQEDARERFWRSHDDSRGFWEIQEGDSWLSKKDLITKTPNETFQNERPKNDCPPLYVSN